MAGEEDIEVTTECTKDQKLPREESCPLYELRLWYVMLEKLQKLAERPRRG